MVDDSLGLFDSPLEAYVAGKSDGQYKSLKLALLIASTVGSECESSQDDHGFHVSEKIAARIKNHLEKRP